VTVISGVERRRVWTAEQKLALVAAASMPGVSVAEVARRADLQSSQIYRWKRELVRSEREEPGFAPVVVAADREPPAKGTALVIELKGAVMRIAPDASPALVAAAVRALRR
jgi:transposase